MKTIIAGSRIINDYELLKQAIEESGFSISAVISGMAGGVDSLGVRWAKENGVELIEMPAQWGKHGKRAGFMRNNEMAKVGEALIVLWDGRSRGTEQMIFAARLKGLRVYVHNTNTEEERD